MTKTEAHIYDSNDNLIFSYYDVSNWVNLTTDNNKNLLNVRLQDLLTNLGFKQGRYKVVLSNYESIVGSINNNIVSIKEISKDRTELRLEMYSNLSNTLYSSFNNFDNRFKNEKNKYFFLNIGLNKLYHINNVLQDNLTTNTYPYTQLIKLDVPLDSNININTTVLLGIKNYYSVEQYVNIIPTNNEFKVNVLSSPNFSIRVSKSMSKDMSYQNYDNLISGSVDLTNKLESKYFNFYQSTSDINIDFTDFSNFVFYSNAEQRLINFRYKVSQLETIEINIAELTDIPTFQQKYYDQKKAILKSFTKYEEFLYYSDDEYAYPKTNGILDSIVLSASWYDNMIDIAKDYDNSNINKLIDTIPANILLLDETTQLTKFVNLLAEHFDILWVYVKNLENIQYKNESLIEGLSKDLIFQMLESYGWNPYQESQFDDLVSYVSGSFTNLEPQYVLIKAIDDLPTKDDANKEIWKRILNNLPYLLKTKGTVESIRSVLSCFGIPRTMLDVKEYGGAEKLDTSSKFITDKFAYALEILDNNTQYIEVPYIKPGTIEYRFKLNDNSTQNILTRSDDNVKLEYEYVSDTDGKINLYVSGNLINSSDTFPIYDTEWWNVMLRHNETTYDVNATHSFDFVLSKAKYNQTLYTYTSSFETIDPTINTELFDTSYNYKLSINGYLQEFRYWNKPLTNLSFNNHTLAPSAYNGNNASSSYDDLKYRLTLGTNTVRYNHYLTSSIESQHPSQDTGSAIFYNFPNEYNYVPIYEQYTYEYPDLSTNRTVSNKIRTETSILFRKLNRQCRAEVSSFDKYPNDSTKIGIYLSPSNEINEDIAESMAGVNIDNLIGGYDTQFNLEYPLLKKLKLYYLKQYTKPYNITEYLRLYRYFNQTVFKQIEHIIPAKCNSMLGMVIEPTILDRSKVLLLQSEPTHKNLSDLNATYNLNLHYQPIGDYELLDSNIELTNDTTLTGTKHDYSSSMELNSNTTLLGTKHDYATIIDFDMFSKSSIYKYTNLYWDSTGSAVYIVNPTYESYGIIEMIGNYRKSSRYEILNPLRSLSGSGEPYYIKAEIQDLSDTGVENIYYRGSKITSPAINEDSNDTPDGKPVIEVWKSSPNNLIVNSGNNSLIVK